METGKFYDQYTVDDFILDERFHRWVMEGRDDAFWQQVLQDYPEKSEAIAAARSFIRSMQIKTHLPVREQEQAAIQRFRERVLLKEAVVTEGMVYAVEDGEKGDGDGTKIRRLGKGRKWLIRIAASVAILGLAGSTSWMLFKKRPVVVGTSYGQMKQIKLPDNSIIYLNANSSLRYHKSILGDFSREVWLDGEAFFQVEKETDRSGHYRNFRVHTQGMAVEVLGTAFNVKDRNSNSSVTLQSGKVQVSMDEGRSVTLAPGEHIEFNRKEHQLTKNKVNPERYTSWTNLRYTFDQTPVSELVQIIRDNYGLEVVITDEKISDSNLSGVLEADNLQTFVNALSFALNITIRKEGNQLIFEPKQK